MNSKFERALPVILSVVSSVGVVATSYFVAKVTPKANERIKKAKETNSKKKIILETIKGYKVPIIIGSATIASIVSGTIISKRIEASLSATAIMLDTTLRKYKGKVKELVGDKVDDIKEAIAEDDYKEKKELIEKKPITDGRVLYQEEHIGFFKAYPNDIERAVAITNEKILTSYRGKERTITDHWASLKTFLEDCNAELIDEEDNPIDDVSFDYGWTSEYMAYTYEDDMFLHIHQKKHKDAQGNIDYVILSFDKDPIFGVYSDYSNWPSKKLEDSGYNAGDLDELENNYTE